jgi:large subunit ribosomal protein L35
VAAAKCSIGTLNRAMVRQTRVFCPLWPAKESQMPKLKTKSGAKKRFKITATGKVLSAMSGKRHGMIKRTNKQIRQHRGTRVMFKADGDNIKKYFLPNA